MDLNLTSIIFNTCFVLGTIAFSHYPNYKQQKEFKKCVDDDYKKKQNRLEKDIYLLENYKSLYVNNRDTTINLLNMVCSENAELFSHNETSKKNILVDNKVFSEYINTGAKLLELVNTYHPDIDFKQWKN